MKTRNIKLVTFGFAAMLLASCSDSNDTPNPTPNPAETGIIGKEVTSITDAQQLAARVYNFKRPSATRAAGVTSANLNQAYTMEAEPTGLDFAKMEKCPNTSHGVFLQTQICILLQAKPSLQITTILMEIQYT